MTRHVVYSRGLLRTEGSMQDGCDYIVQGGSPVFHAPIFAGDIVTIFEYNESTLMKRTDYIAYYSDGGEPLSIKSFREQRFYGNWFDRHDESLKFTEVFQTLPANS